MKQKLFDYVSRRNLIYDLSGFTKVNVQKDVAENGGFTKLLCFLMTTMAVMFSFDLRVILSILLFSLVMLKISQITFAQIKTMLIYVAIFLVLNAFLTFLFDPKYAVELYGTEHVLFPIFGRYALGVPVSDTQTGARLWRTKTLKYASVIPLGIVFFLSTHPSELAASLSRAGIPYKASFALSLTLRYFPDIMRSYEDISLAQQSRGLDLSKKEKVGRRVKNVLSICIPLVFSTLERVDIIANTMDLRGFGKEKKRTWYSAKPMARKDWVALAVCLAILLISIAVSVFVNHSRYWNPFI